jgi:hypothetical protein
MSFFRFQGTLRFERGSPSQKKQFAWFVHFAGQHPNPDWEVLKSYKYAKSDYIIAFVDSLKKNRRRKPDAKLPSAIPFLRLRHQLGSYQKKE